MSMPRRRQEKPTSVKIVGNTPLHNMEAESALTSYIDTIEINDSVSNQLKRIQRDLRGLPPLLRNSTTGESQENDQEDSVMKEASPAAKPEPLTNTGISKEERKRLKKERRKNEQRAKAEGKQDNDDEADE